MSARKADILGHILVCTRYNSYRLLSVETNDQWHYYAALLDYFNNILKKKHSHLAKKKVLFHQDTRVLHVPSTDGQIQRISLQIASQAYSPDSILRLFPVSKKMIRRKEIHHQRAAHRRNRGLF